MSRELETEVKGRGEADQRPGNRERGGLARALHQQKALLRDGRGLYSLVLFAVHQTLLLFTV